MAMVVAMVVVGTGTTRGGGAAMIGIPPLIGLDIGIVPGAPSRAAKAAAGEGSPRGRPTGMAPTPPGRTTEWGGARIGRAPASMGTTVPPSIGVVIPPSTAIEDP